MTNTVTNAVTNAHGAKNPSPERARRRRALVVAYCFPPHAAIGTHRTLRLVSHLVDRGWDVDVLSARAQSYLPGTPVDEHLLERIPSSARVVRSGALRGFTKAGRIINRLRPSRRAESNGLPFTTTSTGPPSPGKQQRSESPVRAFKTLLEELCALPDKDIGWLAPAVLRGLRSYSATPPDVIFSSAPPWTTHLVAHVLASVFRCRWVADFRDPWVRSPWTRYETSLGVSIASRLEQRVVGRADAVIFTTQTARQEFANHYGPQVADRLHVVFNGCDPSEFDAAPDRVDEDHFTLLHAGTLYGGRSPMPLIRAVAGLCAGDLRVRERLRVRFLGASGFAGLDMPRVCADLGLSDVVEFVPRVDRSRSLDEMRRASALLILQAGTSMAIPGKLYEYLAAGRPVLALCEEGEMADFIRANRLGLTAPAEDESQIAQALASLLETPGDVWSRPEGGLFDGRLRAAEMAAIVGAVLEPRVTETICVA